MKGITMQTTYYMPEGQMTARLDTLNALAQVQISDAAKGAPSVVISLPDHGHANNIVQAINGERYSPDNLRKRAGRPIELGPEYSDAPEDLLDELEAASAGIMARKDGASCLVAVRIKDSHWGCFHALPWRMSKSYSEGIAPPSCLLTALLCQTTVRDTAGATEAVYELSWEVSH